VRAAGLLAALTACWTGSPKLVAEPVPVIDEPPACREVPVIEPAPTPIPMIDVKPVPPPNLKPRLKPNPYVRARLRALWFIAMAGGCSPAEAQPSAPPAKAYTLPKQVTDALANEKLAGNVLVRKDALLYANAAAARADAKPARSSPIAMKVVADHGDVVEVLTGPTKDCIASWDKPYQLRVFVKRDKLMPRLTTEIVKTFSDGTAVAIARGAPVTVAADGLQWETLDVEPALPPPDDQLAFSVPALTKPAATLPATLKSERLVCNGSPTPHADWLKKKQRDQDAKVREGASPQQLANDEQWCGIHDPRYRGSASPSTVTPPTVNGKPVKWPWVSKDEANENVVRSGNGFLGDVELPCGRVRMSVLAEGVRSSDGGGEGTIDGDEKVKVWIPSAGPVTWRDGKPAGTFSGDKKYEAVVEERNRICVRIVNVAEPVCFAKARVKTAMVSAWEIY
jgi:hypothetical protein